ncbi:MAG TPA: MFS transporter [Longimicrobiales bacterium]|nr:MFS transporter [Longimicrobiales bacterium]
MQRRLERFFPSAGYYGWTVVVVGMFCSALSSPGQSFALSLYIEHLINDLGFTRVGLSWLYAAATLGAALALPMFGALADRTTARKFIVAILLGMGAALLLLSQAQGFVTVAIALVALRLLGQGAIGLGTLTATVRWFLRSRGRALAIVALGYALGELIFPGLIVALTSWLGWRGSLIALAALYIVIAAPLAARYLRERLPDDLPMDGAPLDSSPVDTAYAVVERDFSFGAALRTTTFWSMLLVVSVSPMLLTAVIFHQVALFDTRGWGAALVPTAFAAYAVAGVLVTYGAGVILERVPVRFGVTTSLLFAVAGLAWYEWGAGGLAGALIYGTLLGTSSAIAGATNSLVWPEYFGIRALGALKGVVNGVRNGATAAGPVLVAMLATAGGFSFGLLALAVIAATGAAAALFILPPPVMAGRDDQEPDAFGRAA